MSVQTGRVVSADEARLLLAGEPGPCCERWDPQFAAPHCDFHPEPPRPDRTITATDLAHTVVVQAEQIAAALALHSEDEDGYCGTCVTPWEPLMPSQAAPYPCPTARLLGAES